jgi:hypothetical protein
LFFRSSGSFLYSTVTVPLRLRRLTGRDLLLMLLLDVLHGRAGIGQLGRGQRDVRNATWKEIAHD